MNFKQLFGEEWYEALEHVLQSDYWKKLGIIIAKERLEKTVYPEKNSDLLFKAFRTTPLSKVKVVILGQDPYHDGSFDGFAFSNKYKGTNQRISPSLVNILQELYSDMNSLDKDDLEWHGDFMESLTEQAEYYIDLEHWAKQGVLLINTAHTVVKGVPDSHTALWKPFTEEVIRVLKTQDRPIVWILWGKRAQNIVGKDSNSRHLVLTSPHPSPFSAYQGFFGSRPFTKANLFLISNHVKSIDW